MFQAQIELGPGTESISTVNFDYVMGDGSGIMCMQDGQRMYLEYDEFSVLRSAPPVNFIIKENAEVWASSDFKVVGEPRDSYPAFTVRIPL